jgi:hypothetical protein
MKIFGVLKDQFPCSFSPFDHKTMAPQISLSILITIETVPKALVSFNIAKVGIEILRCPGTDAQDYMRIRVACPQRLQE